MYNIDYEENFKITLRAMRINRADPTIRRDIIWLSQFFLMHGCYTVVFILLLYNIIFVNLKAYDFSQACKNGILSVVYMAISFQYCVMLWKQRNLKILIDTMKRDYLFAMSLSTNEQKIIHEFAKKGNRVCQQWLMISILGPGLFVVKNMIMFVYYLVTEGEYRLLHLYDLAYPTWIDDRKDSNLVVYVFVYLLLLAYGSYSSVMYCAFVPLGPIFMLHGCGRLEVMKTRIEHLFDSNDLEDVGQKLKDIVKQLQYIYEFVDIIKNSFMVAYELTLKVSTILLPIAIYIVLESLKHGEVSLEFIIFIFGGVLFSSSPCFYSELLIQKSEDVRLAIYSCGWERVYDRGIRSTLTIILQRALRPVAIRALFSMLCLDTLTDVFQQAYRIFNLMNAALD